MTRAPVRPGHELLDSVRLPLGDNLDRPVGAVEHPPPHAEALGLAGARPTEPDTLDVAVNDEPAANHTTSVRPR